MINWKLLGVGTTLPERVVPTLEGHQQSRRPASAKGARLEVRSWRDGRTSPLMASKARVRQ